MASPTRKEIKETCFENRRLLTLGIEPLVLAALRRKVPAAQLSQPERIEFYMLLLVMAGSGRHIIDFVEHTLSPRYSFAAGCLWHPHRGTNKKRPLN